MVYKVGDSLSRLYYCFVDILTNHNQVKKYVVTLDMDIQINSKICESVPVINQTLSIHSPEVRCEKITKKYPFKIIKNIFPYGYDIVTCYQTIDHQRNKRILEFTFSRKPNPFSGKTKMYNEFNNLLNNTQWDIVNIFDAQNRIMYIECVHFDLI